MAAANSTAANRGVDIIGRPSPPPNLAGAEAKSMTARTTSLRQAAAASFDWYVDLSHWRNQITIEADRRDKAARAQKRKARDKTQSRLGDLGFMSRGLSMTLPSRRVSSARGKMPRRVAAEDEVDLLRIDMHQKLDPFQVNLAN